MKLLVVIALIAVALSKSIPFSSCGTGHATLANIDVSPFPPKAGDNVQITATGSVDKDVTEGTYKLTVKDGIIPVYSKSGDICTFSPSFKCPTKAGSITISDSLSFPKISIKGKFHITLSAEDSAGSLFCFNAELDLSAFALELTEDDTAVEFAKFLMTYEKQYESEAELSERYNIFKSNLQMINKHNSEGHSWTLAVNEFADMSWEEFRAEKLGYRKRKLFTAPRKPVKLAGLINSPSSIDWSAKGAVTGIKNQGSCGSCWAFSTTGSVEGAVEIKSGRLTSLSEQQLVDCSGSYGNYGCNGGLMDYAFQYIIATGGLCTESSYPYTGSDGTCKTTCTRVSKISSYTDVTADSEADLEAAVAGQPVSVAVEADQSGFQFYSSGVFDGTCGTSLDHGVLAVGYGTLDGKKYWKVKNSWGASWGDKGYILLAKDISSTSGQCGIAMDPSFPVA